MEKAVRSIAKEKDRDLDEHLRNLILLLARQAASEYLHQTTGEVSNGTEISKK